MVRSLTTVFLILWPVIGFAQSARVAVEEENFRAAPASTVLAAVVRGTTLSVGEAQGRWRRATLEGWIWSASVRAEDRDGHDLIVSAPDGENLRATPSGDRIAQLRFGALLDEVERRGNWVRVRRAGWIWGPSISVAGSTADPGGARRARPAGGGSAGQAGAWSRVGQSGAALLGAPDQDTTAILRAQSPVEVLAREGNWARVRLEGWVWVPALAAPADTGAVLRDISPDLLAASPQAFQGRLVEWSVQFIALEHAEKIRTDFYEGEPFILARGPGESAGFVYIAVSPDRMERVEQLSPLQRITVLGRIRTARSPLMDAPVLDLLSIR